MEEHMRKAYINAGGSGGLTIRIPIPVEYARELGITKESPEVKITLEGKKIIIEKTEEKK